MFCPPWLGMWQVCHIQNPASEEFLFRSVWFEHCFSSCCSYFSRTVTILNSEIKAFISSPSFGSMILQSHAHFVPALLSAFACDGDEALESSIAIGRSATAMQAMRCTKTANAILLVHPVFKICVNFYSVFSFIVKRGVWNRDSRRRNWNVILFHEIVELFTNELRV